MRYLVFIGLGSKALQDIRVRDGIVLMVNTLVKSIALGNNIRKPTVLAHF